MSWLMVTAGVTLGFAYTLSPVSIWAALGILMIGRALVARAHGAERQVLLGTFIVAVAIRVLVIAGLFVSIDHATTPFGSLFGDEAYFKYRSLWLRSIALNVNISEADRVYALDEYSETSYLYWLAFVQMLVGDAPYGVHLLGITAYLGAAVWLYHLCRTAFGSAPALLAFVGVLFMPTLFFWSVSALRESVHFLLTVAAIGSATFAWSHPGWRARTLGIAGITVALFLLDGLRNGSMAVVASAVIIGSVAALAMSSWQRLAIAIVFVGIALPVAASRPAIQEQAMNGLKTTAFNHQGHAFTPGVHYKVLEPRFYKERGANSMSDLTWPEAGRYVMRALAAAAIVPLPWQADTRLLRAYLPEHILWLAMCALFPFGVWTGLRRHRLFTAMTAAYVAGMFTAVALVSGNVGTLVRHRGLVVPFMICLAAVALCDLLARCLVPETVMKGRVADAAD